MIFLRHRAFVLAFLAASVVAAPAYAARRPANADSRTLVDRYANAIVGVELVVTLKVKVGDREAPAREHKVDVNGTVISASGLTVASLAEVDPQIAFEAMRMAQRGAAKIELLGADFKEVKLRLADGTEVPARFALKDADLDLAFIAPDYDELGKRTFAHVDLDKAATGSVLDSFYLVSRAPKSLQRVPLIRRTEVMGIVERPRRFYLLTEHAVGAPVFDGAGRVLGLTLQHFANGHPTGLVVLPAADVADVARQVVLTRPAAENKPAAAPIEPAKKP